MELNFHKLDQLEYAFMRNCRSFYFEASLLLKNKYYARAFSLAYFALEEFSKITVLTYIRLNLYSGFSMNEEYIRNIFRGKLFLDHKTKIRLGLLQMTDISFEKSVELASYLNKRKLKSLYVDIQKNTLIDPVTDIELKDASLMISTMESLLDTYISNQNWKSWDEFNINNIEKYYKIHESEIKRMITLIENMSPSIDFLEILQKLIKNKEMYEELKSLFK